MSELAEHLLSNKEQLGYVKWIIQQQNTLLQLQYILDLHD